MGKGKCKGLNCGETDLTKFYFYSYVKAGQLVRKPMSMCKKCLKIQRVRKAMAKG